MAIVPLGTGLRLLFIVLGCMITGSVVYTIIIDGFPFRRGLLTPWMTTTLIDFYINVIAIGAWVIYKQSSWISTVLWMVLLVCFRSIATCLYITMQFLKLSRKDCTKDPIFHVLQRHNKKSKTEDLNIFSVAIARGLFGAFGCLMLGTLIYTFVTAGSPFHRNVLFPWFSVTLIDFYINIVPLLVWITYKELSLIRSAIWMILLICLGSIGTCGYIVFQLFGLESSDPVHLILFNSDDRLQMGYEKTAEKDSTDDSSNIVG